MKKVNFILLAAGLVMVLLVIEIIIIRSASKYEPEIAVVFAGEKIDQDKIIESDMLQVKKVNISYAHKQSVRKPEDIIGKRAKVEFVEGEMIFADRLAKADEIDMAIVKDSNNRLFTVEFKGDQVNGWWLKSGQYVDIIFVPNEKVIKDLDYVAKSVERLRNIRVAAIIDEKGKLVKDAERTTVPRYVSFELSDSQCDLLAYAKGNGRIEVSVIPEKQSGYSD